MKTSINKKMFRTKCGSPDRDTACIGEIAEQAAYMADLEHCESSSVTASWVLVSSKSGWTN